MWASLDVADTSKTPGLSHSGVGTLSTRLWLRVGHHTRRALPG